MVLLSPTMTIRLQAYELRAAKQRLDTTAGTRRKDTITDEAKAEMVRAYAMGEAITEIARRWGITAAGVRYHLQRMTDGVSSEFPKTDDLTNASGR